MRRTLPWALVAAVAVAMATSDTAAGQGPEPRVVIPDVAFDEVIEVDAQPSQGLVEARIDCSATPGLTVAWVAFEAAAPARRTTVTFESPRQSFATDLVCGASGNLTFATGARATAADGAPALIPIRAEHSFRFGEGAASGKTHGPFPFATTMRVEYVPFVRAPLWPEFTIGTAGRAEVRLPLENLGNGPTRIVVNVTAGPRLALDPFTREIHVERWDPDADVPVEDLVLGLRASPASARYREYLTVDWVASHATEAGAAQQREGTGVTVFVEPDGAVVPSVPAALVAALVCGVAAVRRRRAP